MNQAHLQFIIIALLLTTMYGCGNLERREVNGYPYNAELGCWEEMQPTGKFTRQGICSNAIWHVREKNGQIWALGDDCGKDEFEEIGIYDPLQDVLSRAKNCGEIQE